MLFKFLTIQSALVHAGFREIEVMVNDGCEHVYLDDPENDIFRSDILCGDINHDKTDYEARSIDLSGESRDRDLDVVMQSWVIHTLISPIGYGCWCYFGDSRYQNTPNGIIRMENFVLFIKT